MGLKELVSFSWKLVLALVFCALIPMVKSQTNACSIQDIDLEPCLNQGNSSFSSDTCCKTLNQVVQAGFNCLCLLVASSIPLLSTPLSLPLSNCYISAPPMTLCRVLAPIPIVLSPDIPKELTQPSAPTKNVHVLPPPQERQALLNLSENNNSSSIIEARQPQSSANLVPESSVSNEGDENSSGKDETKILLLQTLFLSLAVHGYILLA